MVQVNWLFNIKKLDNLWKDKSIILATRFILSIVSALIFTCPAWSQQKGELWGQVFSNDPQIEDTRLAGAHVIAPDAQTTTDSNGIFRLKTNYTEIRISYIGYHSKKFSVSIDNPDALQLFYLDPVFVELEEAVVSSGKFQQRIEEVTVSLDVLRPPLIEDKNLVKLEAVLQQAPGVNVTEGQANIRGGSGWTYGAGTRVQTLVDNMPLISGDANQVQWNLVPIYSVDQIEVLKGASSVLYGSAALNGVINVLTHPMPEKAAFTVNLYSGFYGTPPREELKWWHKPQLNSGLNFDLQQALSQGQGLVLSGGVIRDEGFRYLEDESRSRLFGKYFWNSQKIKNLEASLATHLMYSDKGNALLWESDSLGYIPADSAITRSYGWDFYIDPSVSYRHGFFNHQLQSRYLRVNNNVFNENQNYTNSSDLYFGQYTLQAFTPAATFTFGASSSFSESHSVIFVGTHSTTNNALFLQADAHFWEKLSLTGGVRYESYRLDSRSFQRPVFRAGANYQLRKGTNLRASFGQAFRFPSVAEAFTATQVGIVVIYPNSGLKAENGHTYELGIKQIFATEGIKGYIDLAGFRMRYFDMIEYNAAQWGPQTAPLFGFGFSPVNIGNTSITGVELSSALEGRYGNMDYRLLGGYTYSLPVIDNPQHVYATTRNGQKLTYQQTGTDTSTDILKYRYQHLAKMDLQLSWQKWEAGLSLRYNSFMKNIDQIFLVPLVTDGVGETRERLKSGDFVADARLGYRFSRSWGADIIVNNIFNREVMIRPAYLGPPSYWSLRVNYSLAQN